MNKSLIKNSHHNKYDRSLKIIMVGDSYVGKTNILRKYTNNTIYENSHTIGIDFMSSYEKVNNMIIKNNLWDTAGQERYRSIIKSYFKSSDICLLCFDSSLMTNLDDKKNNCGSIKNIINWIRILEDSLDDKTIIWIVGTKIDLLNNKTDNLKEDISEYMQYWRANTDRVIKFAGWCSSNDDVFYKYDYDSIYSSRISKVQIKDLFRMMIKNYIEDDDNNYKTSFNIEFNKKNMSTTKSDCCSIM
jgi:small GTP-binding protein